MDDLPDSRPGSWAVRPFAGRSYHPCCVHPVPPRFGCLPKSWKGKHYGNERSGAHPSSIDGITEARITFPAIATTLREVIGQFDPRQLHLPIGVCLRAESCRSVQKSDCHVKLIT